MDLRARTIVHFIRHGDALPDAETTFTGSAGYDDLGLSAKGVDQARALAQRLAATLDLAAIVSSPTRRAHETAAAVAEGCGRAISLDERLREIDLGDESLPPALAPRERATAIRARLAGLAATALREGSWSSVAGSEPADRVATRIGAAVDDVVRAYPGAHVALVSHAGTINAYFARLIGIERTFFFPTGNTSISSVRIEGGVARVLRLNDAAHLERPRNGAR